jgi:hypothetical protein
MVQELCRKGRWTAQQPQTAELSRIDQAKSNHTTLVQFETL